MGGAILLPTAGCVENLGLADRSDSGQDVEGCTQVEEWDADISSGLAEPPPGSIADRRDCANADRPEPTGDVCETFTVEGEDGKATEIHSVGVQPYPDPPSGFDRETLREFVKKYERAYNQNQTVSGDGANIVLFSFGVQDTTVSTASGGVSSVVVEYSTVVRLYRRDGSGALAEGFWAGAHYGIDETGIVRAEVDDPEFYIEDLPDPVETGNLLQCFSSGRSGQSEDH